MSKPASRRLQLNPSKTEVIWLGTHYCLQQLAGADLNVTIGADVIKPSTVVCDVGVLTDTELTVNSMSASSSAVVSSHYGVSEKYVNTSTNKC